jgi:hypothetical protein
VLRVTTSRVLFLAIVRIVVVVEIMIALVVFLVERSSGDLAQERLSRVVVWMCGGTESVALGLETSLQLVQRLVVALFAVAIVGGHARGTRMRFKYVWCTVDAAAYDVAVFA